MDAQLSFIKLAEIFTSATNPRKTFDQKKIDELAESITEKGVIQPILLRSRGKKYELVCGERRYRASKQAGKIEIPAVIRELTDQEVREIQLVENFQREDPHPMEEAVAILAATTSGQYTVEDLAHKVGKSKKYIAQRLKLNELVPELQAEFFQNNINLTGALKLVTISAVDQQRFLKSASSNRGYAFNSQQIDYFIKQAQGNLDRAVFDLTDPTLSPEFGECTTCPFNSRNQNLLFPDDTKEHVCMNNQDFQKKTEVHFERASKKALEDPTIVLISTNWQVGPEEKKIMERGQPVLVGFSDYEAVEEPKLIEPDKEEYDTDEEYQEAVNEAQQDYESEKAAYEKKQATGKLVQAFVVAGDKKGATMFVELKPKGEQKKAGAAITTGNAEENDIDAEINRLKEREARNKELDQEKVYKNVTEALLKNESYLKSPLPLSLNEYIGLGVALYDISGNDARKEMEKALGIAGISYDKLKVFKALQARNEDDIYPIVFNLMRRFILHKNIDSMSLNPLKYGNAAAIKTIAVEVLRATVQSLEEDQQAVATKRSGKVDTRIKDLQLQKKALAMEKGKKEPSTGKKHKKTVRDLVTPV